VATSPTIRDEIDFTTPVELPLVLGGPENAEWTDAADIVVIGFGSAWA
jgi:hypothetical protein